MDSCNKSPFDWAKLDTFAYQNGVRLVSIHEDGSAVGELTVTPACLNPHHTVHGGCLAMLADSVAGLAVSATRTPCVTVTHTLHFLRPALGSNKKITCTATPEKLGRTLCVYKVSLTDDDGALVATGDFTFFLTGKL